MKEEHQQGIIFDIQGFSVQDGPGIRTTVFMKGCPLRCPWCHSPESQAFYPQLSWISTRCIGVEKCENRCINACVKGAVEIGKCQNDKSSDTSVHLIHVNRALCDNCGKCTDVCYPQALSICGIHTAVSEVLDCALADKVFFDHSNGGVTISGGEALCQIEFVLELLKVLKAAGIHTAVDTTGFVPWESIEKILPYTDLFLYDLKHMDSKKHKSVVGVPNDLILENAVKIAAHDGNLQIRIPIIPMFNDDEENIRKTAEFCSRLGSSVSMVQLLPYHNLGVSKYQRIGDEKAFEALPPSDETIKGCKKLMEEYGLMVAIH